VHLAFLPEGKELADEATWLELKELRSAAQKVLEPFRAEKNQALAAKLVLHPGKSVPLFALEPDFSLADFLGVSKVTIAERAPGDASALEPAAHADGTKCERCWKYTSHPAPTCARCTAVLQGAS